MGKCKILEAHQSLHSDFLGKQLISDVEGTQAKLSLEPRCPCSKGRYKNYNLDDVTSEMRMLLHLFVVSPLSLSYTCKCRFLCNS